MEWNEEQIKILDKSEFYRINELVAHVFTIPKGTFKNGIFLSELIDDRFFWFLENGTSEKIRLFLSEIYDIEDYREKKEMEERE